MDDDRETDQLIEKEQLIAEIADDMKRTFHMNVYDVQPIDKGWLNVKWKVETDHGPRFVKYYHPSRYQFQENPERKRAIENALQLQQKLHLAGIACPQVFTMADTCLLETPSGKFYALLDWIEGVTPEAGQLSEAEMYSLGASVGRMHRWLRNVPQYIKPTWQPDSSAYLSEWRINMERAREAGDETVGQWLIRSRERMESIDFRMFDRCETGWLHWDLWVDNIILSAREVAGIVDFDRMSIAYQGIDVARAILSGALQSGELHIERVKAFLTAYREHVPTFSKGRVLQAFYMLYLIESLWWLRTEVRAESEVRGLIRRFIEEIHWIEDHWSELPDLLGY